MRPFAHVVAVDYECTYTRSITLKKLPLRTYLAQADVLGGAFALDDEEPQWFAKFPPEVLAFLRHLSDRDDTLFIAHNAGFDMRVQHHALGLPYPRNWLCTIELAQCVLPHQAGGYSLENLSKLLNLGDKSGDGTKVMAMSADTLAEYCKQDVRLCRGIYNKLISQVHPHELEIGLLCSRVKEMELIVDRAAAAQAVEGFTKHADAYAETLLAALDDESGSAVGVDDDGEEAHVRSIKPHMVKKLLLENLGFSTQSTSIKKINPIKLATASQETRTAIEAGAKANGALYHKRNVAKYQAMDMVDAELTWAGATATMRFAARSPGGKGVNWHNMPKHDKAVAKLIRSIFRLQDEFCFVRGDEMNVEYRMNGVLSRSRYIHDIFSTDAMADPYILFGQTCTGQAIVKGDPMRQLFKAAVLGLGFLMSVHRWASELVKALGKPKPDFTLDDLRRAAETNQWRFPKGKYYSGIVTSLGCDPVVVIVAANTHRRFHEIHPEFRQLAEWSLEVAGLVCRGGTQLDVDAMYQDPRAPDRDMVHAIVDDRFEGKSLAWRLCGWEQPTVIWRDLAVRDLPKRGPCLSYIAGKKGYRSLHRSLTIENLVQSAARVRTCVAKRELTARGYPYIMSIHDELMPVVRRNVSDVWQARQDLIDVVGPRTVHSDGFPSWAVAVNPDEINVSQSMYEVDVGQLLPPIGEKDGKPIYPKSSAWWDALRTNPDLLLRLP